MRRVNAHGPMAYNPEQPEGYRTGRITASRELGCTELAVKAFEILPGQKLCPYHYEFVEEWLIVLSGRPTVRDLDGEQELEPGDMMAWPAGRDGAHQVLNRGQEPARIVMFSSGSTPAVAVYPDSDKVGVWTGDDTFILHRRDGAVPYYEGET